MKGSVVDMRGEQARGRESLPATPRWDNWSRAWEQASIGRYLFNTVIVVGGVLALTMLLGAPRGPHCRCGQVSRSRTAS